MIKRTIDAITEKLILKAFTWYIIKKGWTPMLTPTGFAWFGGKTHSTLAKKLPEEFVDTNFQDIDFLVVGCTKD